MKSHRLRCGLTKQTAGRRVIISNWLVLAAIALLTLPSTRLVNAQGLLYTVNTTSEMVVPGACANGLAGCSLPGAIEAANSHPGTDGIDFFIPTSDPGYNPLTDSWTINLTKPLPDIIAEVDITGPGANRLTVQRFIGAYRIFTLFATGTVSFSGLTIRNGLATDGSGGAIGTSVTSLILTNCTVSDNLTIADGGGIYNQLGDSTLIGCTLNGNSAQSVGGAIYSEAGTTTLTNCTVSGNSAPFNGGRGGGIFNNNGSLQITNSTISGNSAKSNSGGVENRKTASVRSSIIAINTTADGPDPDVSGLFTSGGFNLVGIVDGDSTFDQPTDQVGTPGSPIDPKLDPAGLQDNGGPTQTIALLFGSPAIEKGTSDGLTGMLTTDQRGSGFVRTFDDLRFANAAGGDGTDIGAFEVQSAAPIETTLGNISTRLRVETGDNVLIGGFIITGTQPKRVLVRAIGSSLPLAVSLADPILELHDSAGALLASNDNWMDSPNKQEIIATTIPPPDDLESAILATLDSGLYTAIMRGVNNTTGIGLVETYDLDSNADSELANISTRGLVQTGDNVMIGGFIIVGDEPQSVLVRAIGPSLPLAGTLTDPTLDLFDGNGDLLASNDDWRDTQQAEIMATMIPPSDDAEAAILQTLPPAAYTAIVRGKNGTTGVALVEVYNLGPGTVATALARRAEAK